MRSIYWYTLQQNVTVRHPLDKVFFCFHFSLLQLHFEWIDLLSIDNYLDVEILNFFKLFQLLFSSLNNF